MSQDTEYSSAELLTINAAHLLEDSDVVFVGVGLPNLACNLARYTHAPNLVMIYEAGVIGAQPARLPLSIGDPTLVSGSLAVCSMYEIFAMYLQRGNIDVGFMGGAQIDRFGNINATIIGRGSPDLKGNYQHPKVRLPGSGGSMEIAAWANRCYIITPHQKRRFPEKVDFRTSAGFLGGRHEREAAKLRGGGPQAVVTDLGIMKPDETGELILTALHPGKTVEMVRENTGWDIKVAPELSTSDPPKEEELRILREELDPLGVYLKA
jgi:glutaconate CoA-transferase subunit B